MSICNPLHLYAHAVLMLDAVLFWVWCSFQGKVITLLRGTDNILKNIPYIQSE